MKPTYLGILIHFQGERSNIGETTFSTINLTSQPIGHALSCCVEKILEQNPVRFSEKVKYIFEQCNVLKDCRISFDIKQNRFKGKKNRLIGQIKACAGFESMLCASKLENFLQNCWHNKIFETHDYEFV